MKNALEARGFASPVADTAGVQFMFTMAAAQLGAPSK
jgi:hypothetical protein